MSARLPTALLAVSIVVALAVPVGASDLEDDLAEVQSRVASVNAQMDVAAAERSAVASELVATEGRLDVMALDLDQTRLQLSLTRDDLNEQQRLLSIVRIELSALYSELAATRQEVGESREDAQHWARQLYMNAGHDEAYLALEAGELADISVGLGYLDVIAEANERNILIYEALQQTEQRQTERAALRQAELSAEVAALGSLEADLAELEAKQIAQQVAIASEISRQQNLLGDLEREIDEFEGELAGLEAEQARIRDAINSVVSSGGTAPTSGFVRPVPGAISSSFGPRTHPILGYVRMHTGLDFRAPYGQEIRAAASGRVIMAGSYGGYGSTIVIDHGGGTVTLYAHQSSFAVASGEQVAAGATIGYIGSTGLSTGPHLHFEVRVGGAPVDPLGYL